MKYVVSLTFVAFLVFGNGMTSAQELVTFAGATMGTRYSVTVAERSDIVKLQEKVDSTTCRDQQSDVDL